jgi:hypothetical protein
MPMWSHQGHEIFYVGPPKTIMATDYEVTGNSFIVRKPRQWSPTLIMGSGLYTSRCRT